MEGILLDPLGLVLTIYSILSQFPYFHQFSIFLQNNVIMKQWFQLHATSSTITFHAIISAITSSMPCHVIISHIIIYVISTFVFLFVCPTIISLVIPLFITKLLLQLYILVIPLSFVNTFDINDNYILNNLPLWNWWKHLNILPLWQQWQRITYYVNVVPILI